MKEDEKEIRKEFITVSSEVRSKLTAASLTVIAAVYFFSEENSNVFVLKLSFVCFVLTIFFEIIAGYCKSQHYALYLDNKIETTGFRESTYGWAAETFFWIPLPTFFLGVVLFLFGIFS